MRRLAAALALTLLAACHLRAQPSTALAALSGDGDVRVYLEPFPEDAVRLAVSLAAVSATRPDGTDAPLTLVLPEVSGAASRGERLLALGRLPPGQYAGIALQIRRATVAGDGGVSDLLAPEEPVRIEAPFALREGRAVVLRLALGRGQALAQEFRFGAAFSAFALAPESSVVQLAGYCSTPALAGLVAFDRRAHRVNAVLPTGHEPRGIAIDGSTLRAYVALAAEDQIQVLDLATGEELRRIPLRPGDAPRELALTPDGAELVTTNPGSHTVSFVDVASSAVVGTVSTGEEPSALLVDEGGRRGYVLNRRSRSITVLDIANRVSAGTVGTDPEPLRAQLSRDGSRLYVVARGSAYLTVLSVPEMAVVRTVFVGLGAAALKIDPRTDLIYVGRGDEGRIQVFDPVSAVPVDVIDVPGPVSYLTLDAVENVLVAVIPSLGQLAFVDVTRKRVVATVDAGAAPFHVALVGERR